MKTVIVTGGSKGIGAAIVKELAKENYQVVFNYHYSEEDAKTIQEELQKQGKQVEICKADVSNREDVKQLVQFTLHKFGKIDVLINNAGIANEKVFQDITDEDFEKVMHTNLYSVFCTTQEVLPSMISQKEGCIINISSVYGTNGGSCAAVYAASKAGIDGITKSLARELGLSNIRVNSIAPGCINTQMNQNLTKEELEELQKEFAISKIGEGIDIAKCIKWLIEDQYTTGQIIKIDGGWFI